MDILKKILILLSILYFFFFAKYGNPALLGSSHLLLNPLVLSTSPHGRRGLLTTKVDGEMVKDVGTRPKSHFMK